MSNLTNVDEAHHRREVFLELHNKAQAIELKLIWQIWTFKDWTNLGFLTFRDYCEAPVDAGGLDISRSWALQLAETYQKFVHELGMPTEELLKIGPRKLYAIKDVVTEENLSEWLGKAESLSQNDLTLETTHVDLNTCKHENLKTIYKCPDCKQWFDNDPRK